MTLDAKSTLKLSATDAQALKNYLVHLLTIPRESAYYQIVQLLLGRIIQKIHKKDLSDHVLKIKLNAEESLALQIAIATNDWPGDDLDTVLFGVQAALPPLVAERLVVPPRIEWEG
ncbi:hypothetical protein [Lewinella sp. W8]|jgi:hypothetical protein|uniref:hypothetical protein n=1 Tax=Lewinella sp. W8 TaxID=2528208 RepID=UPI0010684AED|nr:hypothetical protein [Lewinella sp. W8]MTB50876.1 hypothetical protein [Lewinella sp. W8]